MGTITLPNFRTTADVTMNTRLKDGGVYIDWAGLSNIKAWLYSDAQKAIAGRCDVSIDQADSTKLVCKYSASKPQYLGVQRLIVQAKYMGQTKTYDKPVFNFVSRTAAASGNITIDEPTVDVTIEVTDVSSSILDAAIAAAVAAAAHAEHAASLVPLQVLQDCEAATVVALTAASKAPVIGENGHWWVWNSQQAAYVDTGKQAKGDTGNGIASFSVVESQEDDADNVVTVTFTDGTTESFTVKNGKTGNGIASIVQTVESPDDAGTNVITVTMTNGTVITFNVKNGSKGQPGAAQAAYKSVETLPTASAETMDKIYLTPSGTSGVYNMSYTDYDGSAYSWVDLGTTAIQLSDYATKAEVNDIREYDVINDYYISGSSWYNNVGAISKCIAVHIGDVIHVEKNSEKNAYIAFISSPDTSITPVFKNGFNSPRTSVENETYEVFEECYFWWLVSNTYGVRNPSVLTLNGVDILSYTYSVNRTDKVKQDLEKEINIIDDEFLRNLLISGNIKFTQKRIINSSGVYQTVSDTSMYATEEYYPVKNGDVVKCELRAASGNNYIATYNADKTLRNTYNTTDNALTLNIDFDGYVRFSNQRASWGVMKEVVYIEGYDNLNEISKNGTIVAQEALAKAESYETDGTKTIIKSFSNPQVRRTAEFWINRTYKQGEFGVIDVKTDGTDFYYVDIWDANNQRVQVISPNTRQTGDSTYLFVAEGDAVKVRLIVTDPFELRDYTISLYSQDMSVAIVSEKKLENIQFLPPYAIAGGERILSFLRAFSAHKIEVIGFNTDQHISTTHVPDINFYPIARGLQLLSNLATEFPFNLVCLGGDEAGYSDQTIETVMGDINAVSAIITANVPVVAMAGNHDAGQNYDYIGADGYMEFNTKTKKGITARYLDGFGVRSTNCFFDDNGNNTRFVFLDDWSVNQNEMPTIIESAFSDAKLKNSDWKVIVFSHNVIPEGLNGNNLNPIGNQTWASIKSYIDEGVNVIACFNGHCHCDQQDVKDGVLFIATNSACNNNEQSFDGITYSKNPNTPKETAFDVFVIDYTDSIIYSLRYGAGMDRVFSFGNNKGIIFTPVSGTVSGATVGDVVKVSHNNTEYSYTLTEEMTYAFPYICPALGEWKIGIYRSSEPLYESTVNPVISDIGGITKDIVIS